MHVGLVAIGCVGVAALGTLLYRTCRQEQRGATGPTSATQHQPVASPTNPTGTITSACPLAHGATPGNATPTRTLCTIDEPDTHTAGSQRGLSAPIALPPTIVAGLTGLTLILRGDDRIASTLGIVQGLGEFLPISSSAHLILIPWLFGWNNPGAFYNTQWYAVTLHLGTLLALTGVFWRDWITLIRHAPQPNSVDGRLFWLIALTSVPGAAIGFVLDRFAAEYFRDKYAIIAGALAVMGVLLHWADQAVPPRRGLHEIDWLRALLIGLAQSLAFVPGVSRSGSTTAMGRALGLKRETAMRFSFLMAMPITFGATLLKLKDIEAAALRLPAFWLGIGMSFTVGTLAINFLLRYLRTNSFLPFVIYRLGLSALVVAVYVARASAARRR